jgi:predicted TIM-barrel fold metal-dependent hydrolase
MFKLFSVDDHIVEPRHVWTDRVPSHMQESAPHVIEADGREFWVYEDQRVPTMGLNAVAGKPPEEWGAEPVRFEDMTRGCYDPVARAADFRADGVVASVSFPTLPGFGGRVLSQFKDKQLADVCVRAYNDFVIDEWCAAAPEMFVPTIISQLWDPELAAAEVRRCAEKGARALSFPENTVPLGLPSMHQSHWDPLYRALDETGVVMSMHLGASGRIPVATPDSHWSTAIVGAPGVVGMEVITDLIFSRLPHDYPNIKFVITEGGVGYVPYLLERAEFVWESHRFWAPFHEERPRDVFNRSVWVCSVNESVGLRMRHDIGVENILWELDYPHSETTWPASQAAVEKAYAGIPRDEADLMTHGNAATVFNFPV